MKNKEKYAREIVEAAVRGEHISVDKQSGKISPCFDADCEKCLFYCANPATSTCKGMFSSWANAEYEESKRFTDREKAFVKLFPEIKYLARNRYGDLFAYTDKPFKVEEEGWWTCDDDTDILFEISSSFGDFLKFKSIDWDDEEPTTRKEILKEEKDE